ncbi:hypothetical protein GQ55_5G409200 [Panicum hallii var. hallii]|uniref:Uncharacterized protein n=1 Tax=Panicum hallii var. hallii TaxID=1504633 RepID=A0A2T7DNP0_9POAL|nr:hypothetical protein GQ55_5G409200 [Panicum hallii var. hallii]
MLPAACTDGGDLRLVWLVGYSSGQSISYIPPPSVLPQVDRKRHRHRDGDGDGGAPRSRTRQGDAIALRGRDRRRAPAPAPRGPGPRAREREIYRLLDDRESGDGYRTGTGLIITLFLHVLVFLLHLLSSMSLLRGWRILLRRRRCSVSDSLRSENAVSPLFTQADIH